MLERLHLGPRQYRTVAEIGVNCLVATISAPDELAEAIDAVDRAGDEILRPTGSRFAANAQRLSRDDSLTTVRA